MRQLVQDLLLVAVALAAGLVLNRRLYPDAYRERQVTRFLGNRQAVVAGAVVGLGAGGISVVGGAVVGGVLTALVVGYVVAVLVDVVRPAATSR